MQLDLFEHTNLEPDALVVKFLELKVSQDNLRRGLFQRYQDLRKIVADLESKIDLLIPKDQQQG